MIVNGVWNIEIYPDNLIAELKDGSLVKFNIEPMRKISSKDLMPYDGEHPRKLKGQPLPFFLYRFYGLQKNEESLSEVVRTRISPTEKSNLEAYAKNNDKTPSEVIRDFIRSL